MSTEPICELYELPVSMCACRKHRGGVVVDVETVGQAFEAAYAGECPRCDGPIRPGDTIVRLADGDGYVHSGGCPHG